MTQSEEGILQLSTDAIPERDRVAVWREDWGQRFLTVDIEPDRRGPFHALMLLRMLPGLKIAKVHFSPLVARRTRGLIAGDPDGLFVLANLAGSVTLSQRGCQLTVSPGDALLASCAETLIADHRVPGQLLLLRAPRDTLASLVPDLDDRVLCPIPRDAEALRLLRSYLAVLDDGRSVQTPELARSVVTHINDLIAIAIGGQYDRSATGRNSVRAARLNAMKADIAAGLSQPRLSAKTIARAHGISDRYVHALFETTGQSFSRFVEQERMKRAFELLTDPARSGTPIAALAEAVGYVDHPSFSRAFRRAFGATPSEVRNSRPSDTPER